MIKATEPIVTKWLYQLLRRIWAENRMTEDWHKGIIISIYKKVDREQRGIYRDITLH
jgi:hypothetical protein